jgi:hypothetical protein
MSKMKIKTPPSWYHRIIIKIKWDQDVNQHCKPWKMQQWKGLVTKTKSQHLDYDTDQAVKTKAYSSEGAHLKLLSTYFPKYKLILS